MESLRSSGDDADGDGEATTQEKWDAEYKQLMVFLFERLQVMERSEHRVPGQGAPRKQSNSAAAAPATNQGYKSGGGGKKSTECPQCRKKDHLYLSRCPEFIKMNSQQRHADSEADTYLLQLFVHVTYGSRLHIQFCVQNLREAEAPSYVIAY